MNRMNPSVQLLFNIDRKDLFPYCCFVCRRTAAHCPGVNLSRCGKCKRVFYCSRDCQKQDFKKHKYLCQLMHDVPLLSDSCKTRSEWSAHLRGHLRQMRMASTAFYGKDIWQLSFGLWLGQIHCQSCFSQVNLTICSTCGCVAHCNNSNCKKVFNELHSPESCECHCIRLAAYVMAKQQGNYLKVASRLRNPSNGNDGALFTPLPSTWGKYWSAKITDYEVPEALLRLPPVLAMLTDSMSYIFTAMHCLQQLHNCRLVRENVPSDASTLCIHFIGADVLDIAGGQAGIFEEILHWFPNIRQLEVVLVGPDMQSHGIGQRRLINDGMCSACSAKRCNVYITCISEMYHVAVNNNQLLAHHMPDVAMLCNSGLHEMVSTEGSLANMWAPTLQLLHGHKIPIAATSYTRQECEDDFKQLATVLDGTCDLEALKEHLVIPPSRNPFRGLLPMPDAFCDNEFFYNNNYYFVVDYDEHS